MINKINNFSPINKINYVTSPNFKGEQSKINKENEIKNYNMNGLNALAIYNSVQQIQPCELDIEPSEMILDPNTPIEEIKGEKITDSKGNLVAIIDKNDETTKNYNFKDGKIENIEIINKDGQILKSQIHFSNIENNNCITVYDYKNGKDYKTTGYINNTLMSVNVEKNGKRIDKSFTNNHFEISNIKKNGDFEGIHFDNNKMITNIYSEKKRGLTTYNKEINFENGGMYSVRETKETIVPNMIGHEKLNNPDLIPASRFNIPENTADLEGEKTYYSNGNIESNKVDNVVYSYDYNGNLNNIKTDKVEVQIGKNMQTIIEQLDDNKIKTTELYDEGNKNVEIKDNEKTINYNINKNGLPHEYSETLQDGSTNTHFFNKNGMLEWNFNYKN